MHTDFVVFALKKVSIVVDVHTILQFLLKKVSRLKVFTVADEHAQVLLCTRLPQWRMAHTLPCPTAHSDARSGGVAAIDLPSLKVTLHLLWLQNKNAAADSKCLQCLFKQQPSNPTPHCETLRLTAKTLRLKSCKNQVPHYSLPLPKQRSRAQVAKFWPAQIVGRASGQAAVNHLGA